MSERVQRQRQDVGVPGGDDQATAQVRVPAQDTSLDDLLDSIDAVLENNAEEYVRSFVQKGGQ